MSNKISPNKILIQLPIDERKHVICSFLPKVMSKNYQVPEHMKTKKERDDWKLRTPK
jgi:hypothetical protein